MATSTLANPHSCHQSFPEIARLFAPPSCPKTQPAYLVFPTGMAEYQWRVAALATKRTISRHKSLAVALRKCTRLNKQHGKGTRNETN